MKISKANEKLFDAISCFLNATRVINDLQNCIYTVNDLIVKPVSQFVR